MRERRTGNVCILNTAEAGKEDIQDANMYNIIIYQRLNMSKVIRDYKYTYCLKAK